MALEHLGKSDPFNPYLNIKVSEEIIGDHNDIWGIKLQSFIQALIKIATTDQSPELIHDYDEKCAPLPKTDDDLMLSSGQ